MRIFVTLLVAFTVAAVPPPAFAVSFGVEAGLDKKTRKFLNAYPSKIREQIIRTLRDALPLYKEGVAFTFNRADESIKKAFSEVECVQSSIPITAQESARGLLAAFGFGGHRYGSRTATNLDKQFNQMRKSIDGNIKPQLASLAYLDVLGTAHATDCFYRAQPIEAVMSLRMTTDQILAGQRVWNYLIGFGCDSPRTCYDAAHKFDAKLIESMDIRDVKNANAIVRLAKLPKPNIAAPNGFDVPFSVGGFFGGYFDIGTYENNVRELNAIQFDVNAQALTRTKKALALIEAYEKKLVAYDGRRKILKRAFDGRSSHVLADTFKNGAGLNLLSDIDSLDMKKPLSLSDADIVSSELKKSVDTQKRIAKEVAALNAGYSARFNRMRAIEQLRIPF